MKQTRSSAAKGAMSLAKVAPLTANDSRKVEIFMVWDFVLGWEGKEEYTCRRALRPRGPAAFCRPWLVTLANIGSSELIASAGESGR